jgi:hypothetical protein
LEVFSNLLIPESDVGLVVVDDGSELFIAAEIVHERFHALYALDEIDDLLFIRLFVEGAGSVFDSLAEDGWKTRLHSCMGEGIFMIATICGPRRVVRIDLEDVSQWEQVGRLDVPCWGSLARAP